MKTAGWFPRGGGGGAAGVRSRLNAMDLGVQYLQQQEEVYYYKLYTITFALCYY